ncbi:hypothetical protein RI367_002684 [Sorochytrium milnesiophthora]
MSAAQEPVSDASPSRKRLRSPDPPQLRWSNELTHAMLDLRFKFSDGTTGRQLGIWVKVAASLREHFPHDQRLDTTTLAKHFYALKTAVGQYDSWTASGRPAVKPYYYDAMRRILDRESPGEHAVVSPPPPPPLVTTLAPLPMEAPTKDANVQRSDDYAAVVVDDDTDHDIAPTAASPAGDSTLSSDSDSDIELIPNFDTNIAHIASFYPLESIRPPPPSSPRKPPPLASAAALHKRRRNTLSKYSGVSVLPKALARKPTTRPQNPVKTAPLPPPPPLSRRTASTAPAVPPRSAPIDVSDSENSDTVDEDDKDEDEDEMDAEPMSSQVAVRTAGDPHPAPTHDGSSDAKIPDATDVALAYIKTLADMQQEKDNVELARVRGRHEERMAILALLHSNFDQLAASDCAVLRSRLFGLLH